MINPHNEIYTKLRDRLKDINVKLSSGYQTEVAEFPAVTFDEISNITDLQTLDSAGEFGIEYSFEINIYSNATNPMNQITKIITLVDELFNAELKMFRNFTGKTPNFLDNKVYKYTMRYSCIVTKNNEIFRR